jgi:hypothetical protein
MCNDEQENIKFKKNKTNHYINMKMMNIYINKYYIKGKHEHNDTKANEQNQLNTMI